MSQRCRLILAGPMAQAYALLPDSMRGERADAQLLAIGLQESRLTARRQHGNGPARGLWQFEAGGGVKGVLTHPATRTHALKLCEARNVAPVVGSTWSALEHDDVLAAGFARLNLWWLPQRLPGLAEPGKAWAQYISAWRPGRPHRDTWDALHAEAVATVIEARA